MNFNVFDRCDFFFISILKQVFSRHIDFSMITCTEAISLTRHPLNMFSRFTIITVFTKHNISVYKRGRAVKMRLNMCSRQKDHRQTTFTTLINNSRALQNTTGTHYWHKYQLVDRLISHIYHYDALSFFAINFIRVYIKVINPCVVVPFKYIFNWN